jgi:hypothetical protein
VTLQFVDPDAAQKDVRTRPSALSWVLGGIGALASVGGGIAYGLGVSERNTLLNTCAGPRVCSASGIEASRSKLIAGDVLLASGLVALAAAWVLYLVAPLVEQRAPKSAVLGRFAR